MSESKLHAIVANAGGQLKSLADIADWAVTPEEDKPVQDKLALFDADTPYKTLGEALGVHWEVARAIRLSEEFGAMLLRRLNGLVNSPSRFIAVHQAMYEQATAAAGGSTLMEKVAYAKYLDQQAKVLQPLRAELEVKGGVQINIQGIPNRSQIPEWAVDAVDVETVPALPEALIPAPEVQAAYAAGETVDAA
jgi:hypothetical protein